MKHFTHKMIIVLLLLCGTVFLSTAEASRIKELAQIEGVRSNQLIGYGLVVGLNGTGDSSSTQFTVQSLVSMMERLGVTVDPDTVKVDNVAAVVVTAELPAFARAGNTIDVSVSSVGDAENLAGGTLLMTPLKGADGKYYAVAQGSMVVGSLAFGGKAAKVQKNHPTSGRIPDGALVEREVPFVFGEHNQLNYRLKDSDFTTVSRMSQAVNAHFGSQVAQALDAGQMQVTIPKTYQDQVVAFVSELERLEVTPDTLARIVVNEKTGTIVMGEGVRISTVAVSHGNLNLVISERTNVSQPNAFAEGETVATPETDIGVVEEAGNLVVLNQGVSIGDVATALNAIGATPRDLIAIFQAIKAAGALYADLVVL
ncbi:flagellar P-ring protein precursor FlgI [Desulfuromusa kysingii]|uniref:Flagellar P-ring protein n=1 Tax=Desulfuromusa kysingii TaxID=37625 RepID=A0A1H3VGC0_9BACT|nr:flagellar basal body P-ring protein FlgI [Desulfuromusa kysingii]SDZ73809.1 flagellar P-ring protein precursor FlgI [Desulfuromusa kysingii]